MSEPPTIVVTCDREHTKGKRWAVSMVAAQQMGPTGFYWAESPDHARLGEPRQATQYYLTDEDRFVSASEMPLYVDRLSTRFVFDCSFCPARCEVTPERLFPILDTLATRGLDSISLRGLAAILR